eukprot:TRINITY_DN18792_c0_g1_i1.p1 TRINITY_DN18792_c0_g1~~TRINITY_DN18792_c0_g1_i1.p1  ORF type:complete len:577 (+),score=162.10 TRINITY_DN18792_c0_g1_i1:88-1818(+)
MMITSHSGAMGCCLPSARLAHTDANKKTSPHAIFVQSADAPLLKKAIECDVLVVGLGNAGACAAIEASENTKNKVIVADRFGSGGASYHSGGVFYAGGGTPAQKACGFGKDTTEDMYKFLVHEQAENADKGMLERFCKSSLENMTWLEDKIKVNFKPYKLHPTKVGFPPDYASLYFSGNEGTYPANSLCFPAARGHRPAGKGHTGKHVYHALQRMIISRGIPIKTSHKLEQLIVNADGNVVGARLLALRSPAKYIYNFIGNRANYQGVQIFPPFEPVRRVLLKTLEKLFGKTVIIRAKKGVVLSTGGFMWNRKLVAKYAPEFLKGKPIGTCGDDGTAITVGEAAGGATSQLHLNSIAKFYTPPDEMAKGVLVDQQGKRITSETYYGGSIGDAILMHHGAHARLIVDKKIMKKARNEAWHADMAWSMRVFAFLNGYVNHRKGRTLKQLAARCGVDAAELEKTIAKYNEGAAAQKDAQFGKDKKYLQPISTPPYYGINNNIRNQIFVSPCFSLGGLSVDNDTGEVLRKEPQGDQKVIKGLYAAGRAATGVCTAKYFSGLSIGDCVFSGRRAGRHLSSL